ncbi:MAG: right-handed parallel beta-helix repeat-containing protein [Candidatus Thermoplasmatota archaeon]|nr:right-handed parallel beta-helix repeat-containing protein [Candidatus Thermoplasmatota archaeon]MBU1940413.1 right-handed parallel beta-helix repeat-containing protein [Candidatus Thermoplasmatota archaeon]
MQNRYHQLIIITTIILLLINGIGYTAPARTSTSMTSGFFSIQEIDDVWWFIDPEGEKFFSSGISFVDPSQFCYDPITEWANTTLDQLHDLRFNTINGGATDYFPDIPHIYKFKLKQLAGENGWAHRRIPDVFDPIWQQHARQIINETANKYRNDSTLIGYQTDNEMKWGPDILDTDTLLEVFFQAKPSTAGKQQVVQFLREQYAEDVTAFNHAWNMCISSFDDLYNLTTLGRIGWLVLSGPAKSDIDIFSRLVAYTYFNFTSTALKQADPHHLNLGVRFFFQGVPFEVLEECGRHVDVISMNYYRMNIQTFDPAVKIMQTIFRCVSSANWMYDYYNITKKPLLISEYSFDEKIDVFPLITNPALSNRGLVLSTIHGYSQEQRAEYFEWYATNCLLRPYMVGHVWFTYRDKLNVVNYGIVNIWDEPYEILCNKMKQINTLANIMHNNADAYQPPDKETQPLLTNTYIPSSLYNTSVLIKNYQLHKNIETNHQDIPRIPDHILITGQNSIPINHNGSTRYVGGSGPGNYTQIQDAINDSKNGDSIYVYTGTYNETLYIPTSLQLIGENCSSTIISGLFIDDILDHSVITIVSDDVLISGFTITSHGGYYLDFYQRTTSGIDLFKVNNCSINGNIFHQLGNWGIRARLVTNFSCTDNSFSVMLNKLGCGIMLDSSAHITLANNSISEVTVACIWLARSNHISISHNNLASCLYSGIMLDRTTSVSITNNNIEKNIHTGMIIQNTHDTAITKNNFLTTNTHNNNNSVASMIHPYYRYILAYDTSDTIFHNNYWGRPRLLPKLILIKKTLNDIRLPGFNIDPTPAFTPFNI